MLSTENILNPLLEIGLNKYEAKVYLTLVGEGISTAKNVSDITGIPYGKVYEIINSLASKGFCTVLPSKPMKCQAASPKEAIFAAKKNMHEKYERLEEQMMKDLEPMFAESKKFIEPKGVFWIINGRANIIKKIEELVKKANHHIYIYCSSNGLSRLVLHKEVLEEAKKRGVEISISSMLTKEVMEELKSLQFCNIRKVKSAESHLYSIDGQECLIVEPIPDDDNIVYGRDLGVWVSSPSFTKFLEGFFTTTFKRSVINQENKAIISEKE